MMKLVHLLILLLFLGLISPNGRAAVPTTVWQTSRALALTPNGAHLLVVNPDSDSLTVLNTADLTVLVEIPVGNNPRTVAVDSNGQRAYVAIQDEDTVAVVDLAEWATLAHIPVGRQPYGVLVSPNGEQLLVSVQGGDEIVMVRTASLEISGRWPVPDRPRALALSPDGRTLFVSHLLQPSITVLPLYFHAVYLPFVGQGGGAEVQRGRGENFPPAPLPLRSPALSVIPLFANSNLLSGMAIAPDGRTAYLPHSRANTANPNLTFETTVFPLVAVVDLETGTHLLGQQFDLGVLDPPGVGLPYDAAVSPNGTALWVVNAASNDITVLDLATRQKLAHIEVGDYPQAILFTADGGRAFVNNTLAGTVSVIETATYTVSHTIAATHLPLPPLLLLGKQLFHSSDDGRMGQSQWISCNSCHFEGEQDGRTWTFGFAGPRNTTSLRGMIHTYPLRWSAEWDESADTEFAIRRENFGSGLLTGEMHCAISPPDCANQPPNQGRAYELDALAAYMDSLPKIAPSGRPQTPAEQRGEDLLLNPTLGCVACHRPPLYTDHLAHDVGTSTADERIGPAYDTPTLWGLADSAPYFHDGSAPTLLNALTRPTLGNEHNLNGVLTAAELADLIAFLQSR